MRKQIFCALAATLLVAPPALAEQYRSEATIPPEVTTAVEMSNSDINRVVCPGTMSDLIFSREKGLDGHFSGNSAYLKFQVKKRGDEMNYATAPTEVFVVCNDTVYSLIATPKSIPSQTLRLAPSPGDRVRENIDRYHDLPLEKRAVQLIRAAAVGDYPAGYRVMAADVQIRLSADLDTRLVRVVDVEGVGLRLKEILIKSQAEKGLELTETDFLKADIGENILAVAVEEHRLAPGAETRALVVEQKEAKW